MASILVDYLVFDRLIQGHSVPEEEVYRDFEVSSSRLIVAIPVEGEAIAIELELKGPVTIEGNPVQEALPGWIAVCVSGSALPSHGTAINTQALSSDSLDPSIEFFLGPVKRLAVEAFSGVLNRLLAFIAYFIAG
jgi:hypothetical protein